MALVEPATYNQLPSLEEATSKFQAPSIPELMNGSVRDVFINFDAHKHFCLYLQHRHHTLGHGEAVVKVHGTAHILDKDAIDEIQKMGNKVVPATWMGAEMQPAEFAVVPEQSETVAPSAAFVNELSKVLADAGYADVFGIDSKAENDWSELSVGSSSVVVPSSGEEVDGYIPVAFVFDEKKPSFEAHGRCKDDHRHTSKA